MRYLSRHGITNISRIGLGTGRFGTLIEESLAFDMLDRFVEKGGNVIDTARNYYEWVEGGRGVSEKTIGKWISSRNNRDRVVLCTKGGVRNNGNVFTPNLSMDNLIKELHESLEALETDHIDLYVLHRDESEREIAEIAETLSRIREIASCKAVGVSNWKLERLQELNKYCKESNLPRTDVAQVWWSIAEPTAEMWNDSTTTWMDADLYKYLQESDMTVMASTSQSKGFFQKAVRDGLDSVSDKLKQRIASEENLRRLDLIREYCENNVVSPTAVVNGYITENDLPGIALVSCSSVEQLDEILDHTDDDIDREWLQQFDPHEAD